MSNNSTTITFNNLSNLVTQFNETNDIQNQLEILKQFYECKNQATIGQLSYIRHYRKEFKIKNNEQLILLINKFINSCNFHQDNYELTSEQQYILQILYDICPKDKDQNSILTSYIENITIRQNLYQLNEKFLELINNGIFGENLNHLFKIINKGINLNISNSLSGSRLIHRLTRKQHENILDIFINNGGDLNAQTYNGYTVLHFAAQKKNNSISLIKFITNGANIHIETNYQRYTALHYAAEFNNVKAIKELVSSGANLYAMDKDHKNPLEVANSRNQKYANQEWALSLQCKEAQEILVQLMKEHEFKKKQELEKIEEFEKSHKQNELKNHFINKGFNPISAYIKSKFSDKNFEFQIPRAIFLVGITAVTTLATLFSGLTVISLISVLAIENLSLNITKYIFSNKQNISDSNPKKTILNNVLSKANKIVGIDWLWTEKIEQQKQQIKSEEIHK